MAKTERGRSEHSPTGHRRILRAGRAMLLYGGIIALLTLCVSCGPEITTSTVVPTCDAQATVSADIATAQKAMTQLVGEGRRDVASELAAAMTERPSQNYACKPTATEQSGVIFQTETSTPSPVFAQTGLPTPFPFDDTNYTPAPGIEETMWAARSGILTSTAQAEATSQPYQP